MITCHAIDTVDTIGTIVSLHHMLKCNAEVTVLKDHRYKLQDGKG